MSVQLYLGDCLEVMKSMPDKSVDAVITDPPYNSGLNYGPHNDNMPIAEYWGWLKLIIDECNRIARNMVVVKHSALKIPAWSKEIGAGRMVVWYKPFSRGFRVNGFATHFEPLWVMKGKTVKWSKDVIIQSSGNCNHEASTGHPAQMPEGLAQQIIDICTKLGDTILDPFMGSGTTGVACVQTGRNFIGIEIDPTYFAIAERRIKEAQEQLKLELE